MKKIRITDEAKHDIAKFTFLGMSFFGLVLVALIMVGMVLSLAHIILDTTQMEGFKDPLFMVYFGFVGWMCLAMYIVYRMVKWVNDAIDWVENEK